MANTRQQEGFVILNEKKLPAAIVREISHYNGLLKAFDQTPGQQLAIINSELRIKKLLNDHRGIYPLDVVFGHIQLTKLLVLDTINVPDFINKLNEVRQQLGIAYIKKLLLFEPQELIQATPAWGFTHSGLSMVDINGTQNNLFMLATKTGNVDLVKSILNSIEDIEFKKSLLLQCMQYWGDTFELKFKPILEIAIESGSSDLVDFLMLTMDRLGILKQAASEYTTFTSTTQKANNLLKKAAEIKNVDILDVILSYKEKLGRLFFVFSDKTYPNYILSNITFVPVFVTSVSNNTPKIFLKVLDETIQVVNLNETDDFFTLNYKIRQLTSYAAMINLPLYIRHSHFNPVIFEKLLHFKIKIHDKLLSLSVMTEQFSMQTGNPLATYASDNSDQNTMDNLSLLWNESPSYKTRNRHKQRETNHFKLENILHRLFKVSILSHNYIAAGKILSEYFNNDLSIKINHELKTQNKKVNNLLCNYLMINAVKTQNSNQIEHLSKMKFDITRDVFNEITSIANPNTFIFLAKELFYHLHSNRLHYKTTHAEIILNKILEISKNNTTDSKLNESIYLFLDEMKEYKNKPHRHVLFGIVKHDTALDMLLHEITRDILLHHQTNPPGELQNPKRSPSPKQQ